MRSDLPGDIAISTAATAHYQQVDCLDLWFRQSSDGDNFLSPGRLDSAFIFHGDGPLTRLDWCGHICSGNIRCRFGPFDGVFQ